MPIWFLKAIWVKRSAFSTCLTVRMLELFCGSNCRFCYHHSSQSLCLLGLCIAFIVSVKGSEILVWVQLVCCSVVYLFAVTGAEVACQGTSLLGCCHGSQRASSLTPQWLNVVWDKLHESMIYYVCRNVRSLQSSSVQWTKLLQISPLQCWCLTVLLASKGSS